MIRDDPAQTQIHRFYHFTDICLNFPATSSHVPAAICPTQREVMHFAGTLTELLPVDEWDPFTIG